MSELIRSITARLRAYLGNRRSARRYEVRLPFSLSLLETRSGKAKTHSESRSPSISGETRDISATGLELIVPSVRIGDQYLTGEDRILHIALELPQKTVEIHAIPVRYEPLPEDMGKGYLIGAHITSISEADRSFYTAYLEQFAKERAW